MSDNRLKAEDKDEIKAHALAYLACEYKSSNEDTDDEFVTDEKTHEEFVTDEKTHEEFVTDEKTHEEFVTDEKTHSRSSLFCALPLPPSLIGMYTDSGATGAAGGIYSDRERHAGRIRSFAHERGNWATYVYVPYSLELDVKSNMEHFLSSLPFKLQPCEDFHISLSKTVILKHHWIQPFVDQLKSILQTQKQFHVSLPLLEVYTNEEETRTFLGLKVEAGRLNLHRLVQFVDECLSKYRLPSFYKTPSFHLSIGWCLGNNLYHLKEKLPIIQALFESEFQESCTLCVSTVNCIECKTGDKIFNIPLICS